MSIRATIFPKLFAGSGKAQADTPAAQQTTSPQACVEPGTGKAALHSQGKNSRHSVERLIRKTTDPAGTTTYDLPLRPLETALKMHKSLSQATSEQALTELEAALSEVSVAPLEKLAGENGCLRRTVEALSSIRQMKKHAADDGRAFTGNMDYFATLAGGFLDKEITPGATFESMGMAASYREGGAFEAGLAPQSSAILLHMKKIKNLGFQLAAYDLDPTNSIPLDADMARKFIAEETSPAGPNFPGRDPRQTGRQKVGNDPVLQRFRQAAMDRNTHRPSTSSSVPRQSQQHSRLPVPEITVSPPTPDGPVPKETQNAADIGPQSWFEKQASLQVPRRADTKKQRAIQDEIASILRSTGPK